MYAHRTNFLVGVFFFVIAYILLQWIFPVAVLAGLFVWVLCYLLDILFTAIGSRHDET